jgi:hypothetical protein
MCLEIVLKSAKICLEKVLKSADFSNKKIPPRREGIGNGQEGTRHQTVLM